MAICIIGCLCRLAFNSGAGSGEVDNNILYILIACAVVLCDSKSVKRIRREEANSLTIYKSQLIQSLEAIETSLRFLLNSYKF